MTTVRSDSWRSTISFIARTSAAMIERPLQPKADGDVVGGITWLELIEVPEALLPDRRGEDEDLAVPSVEACRCSRSVNRSADVPSTLPSDFRQVS